LVRFQVTARHRAEALVALDVHGEHRAAPVAVVRALAVL
jgi:hypothetical protein